MKEKIINELLGINSIEKTTFLEKTSYNYCVDNFNDFKKLYEILEKEIPVFFETYNNKNKINKIPKPFELIFYGYFTEYKKIEKKFFNKFKKEIKDYDFSLENKKMYISIYDILESIVKLKENFNKLSINSTFCDKIIKDFFIKKKTFTEKEFISFINNKKDKEALILEIADFIKNKYDFIYIIIDNSDKIFLEYKHYKFLVSILDNFSF